MNCWYTEIAEAATYTNYRLTEIYEMIPYEYDIYISSFIKLKKVEQERNEAAKRK